MMKRTLQLALLACACFPAFSGDTRIRIVNTNLETIDAELISADQRSLQFRSHDDQETQLDWGSIVAMSVQAPTDSQSLYRKITPQNHLAFVETTDGQRLFVTLLDSDDPDFLVGSMGNTRLRINLEHVRSVERYQQSINTDPLGRTPLDADDSITLSNGDTLTGYIASIGSSVTIETATNDLIVPLAQIHALRLANPPYNGGGPLMLVCSNGVRFFPDEFTVDPETSKVHARAIGGVVRFDEPGPTLGHDEDNWPGFDLRLAGVIHKRNPTRVFDPFLRGSISIEPTGDRDWTLKPTIRNYRFTHVDAGFLGFNAPAAVRVSLDHPPHTELLLRCQLDTIDRPWNDHDASINAVLSDGTIESLWSARRKAGDQRIVITAEIPQDAVALQFRIDPGAYGPIQDIAEFSMIRVKQSPQFQ